MSAVRLDVIERTRPITFHRARGVGKFARRVLRGEVVERTHAWNERARRLVMHHDRLTEVSEAWVWLTEGRMLLRRLTT